MLFWCILIIKWLKIVFILGEIFLKQVGNERQYINISDYLRQDDGYYSERTGHFCY
jgi:hypothetical protein